MIIVFECLLRCGLSTNRFYHLHFYEAFFVLDLQCCFLLQPHCATSCNVSMTRNMASNPSQYIFNLIVYLEKSDGVLEVGQVEQVRCSPTDQGLSFQNHIVLCDNFFMMPSLFDSSLRRNIFATGTVRGTRVAFPTIVIGFKRGEHPKSTFFRQMHSSTHMAATSRFDSTPVSFLSTSASLVRVEIAMRWTHGVHKSTRSGILGAYVRCRFD